MVEQHTSDNGTQLVLMPNKSMSWETNKKILAVIFCVNLAIALTWTAMGAWMVLPFAGLEVFLVGLGMYYVCWKLNFKHIITIQAESLVLQKGVYFPKQEWHWQRGDTVLVKTPSRYRMSAPTLNLKHLREEVEIGDFLTRKEKKQLREHLQDLDIRVVTRQPIEAS